jgi:hypothetical protein
MSKTNPSNSDLDLRRIALDEKRYDLDATKQSYDQRFANRHLATLITAAVSLLGITFSAAGIVITYFSRQAEIQVAGVQKEKEVQLEQNRQIREWRLRGLTLLLDHRKDLLIGDLQTQAQFRDIIQAVFPDVIAASIFKAIAEGQRNRATMSASTKIEGKANQGQLFSSAAKIWEDGRSTAIANVDAKVRLSLLAALAATSSRVSIDTSKTPVAFSPANLFNLTLVELGLLDSTQIAIFKNNLKVLLPGSAVDIDLMPINPDLGVSKIAQLLILSARVSVK